MAQDLSHWDFAEEFDGWEAAALILGLEPSQSQGDEARIRVVWDRMQRDFQRALMQCLSDHYDGPPWVTDGPTLKSNAVRRLERSAPSLAIESGKFPSPPKWWSNDLEGQKFEKQRFTRASLCEWLRQAGRSSIYAFAVKKDDSRASVALELDPADLPSELQAANIAFRAVLNGYGDPEVTFKNRLIAYLQASFKDLSPDAITRIATVANPDKGPGRKKKTN